MAVRTFQFAQVHPKAMSHLHNALCAFAKAGNQLPFVAGGEGSRLDPVPVNVPGGRFIAARILSVAADFAPEQQVVPQQVRPPKTAQRPVRHL